jgi:hypothetical protein
MPQAPLVNMFLEFAVTEPKQFSLISHPGLAEEGTSLGYGPVKALFQKDGVLSSAVVGVSDNELYVSGVSVGAIAGSGVPSITGNEIGVVATSGGDAVFYDGTDFSTVDFPDGANVRKVIEQGGRFIFLRDQTGAAYYSEVLADMLVGGIVTIDGLSYFTAESEPDQLLDAVALQDRIAFGGTATIEIWVKTGDAELPYTPIAGLAFQKGVRATGCMAAFDNSFAFVSPDHIVYFAANVPQRISDAGIEELIAASSTCRVDAYFFEGHEFLKVHLDETCLEYDAQTQQWAERKTGIGNFQGGPVITGPVFGSTENGNLLEPAEYADIGSYHERSFCLHFPIDGGAVPIDNLRLRTNPGHTDYLTGDYTDPSIELFQSFDGGMTFETPLEENLGEQGEYRREVEFRALGMADAPGFFGRLRVTDPVSVRCSGAWINEPHGGRSR